MNNKPIVLVTGATGAQGGSVADALLASRQYNVRFLTRDASSHKSIALQNRGAVAVEGDLDDIESLKTAMDDCYAVFGVTNFWEHYQKEFNHGKNLVDAVKQSGISHFIFSTLPDLHARSNGKYAVPHCDLKAELEAYTKSKGIPATFVHVAFYYQNFLTFFPLQPDTEGRYYFGFPQGDTKLAMVNVEDLGSVVYTILEHPKEYIGRVVGVVGEDLTCKEYAAIMSKVLGRNIYFQHIPHEVYANLGFTGAEELANMFEAQRLFIPERSFDLIESYGLNPSMQRLEAWLANNRESFFSEIPVESIVAS